MVVSALSLLQVNLTSWTLFPGDKFLLWLTSFVLEPIPLPAGDSWRKCNLVGVQSFNSLIAKDRAQVPFRISPVLPDRLATLCFCCLGSTCSKFCPISWEEVWPIGKYCSSYNLLWIHKHKKNNDYIRHRGDCYHRTLDVSFLFQSSIIVYEMFLWTHNHILDMLDIYVCGVAWLDYYINYNYAMGKIRKIFMIKEQTLTLTFITEF